MGICRINFIANGMTPNIFIFNLPCLGKKLKESGKFTKYLSHNLFWGKTNILITMLKMPVCESFKFQVWQRAICIMHCKGKIKTRKNQHQLTLSTSQSGTQRPVLPRQTDQINFNMNIHWTITIYVLLLSKAMFVKTAPRYTHCHEDHRTTKWTLQKPISTDIRIANTIWRRPYYSAICPSSHFGNVSLW